MTRVDIALILLAVAVGCFLLSDAVATPRSTDSLERIATILERWAEVDTHGAARP